MYATYSPEDNKLRLYPESRLDPETYAIVRDAGFRWAGAQELFVAPMWTPEREDLLLELCDEIEPEGESFADRQAARSERFENYHEARERDAENAAQAAHEVAHRIPLGQPILIGHHSEGAMRAHYRRVQRLQDKAVKNWRTAKFWEERAKAVKRHASYKAQPGVRARRIKKLEAERRRLVAQYTPREKRVLLSRRWDDHRADAPKIPHVWCGPGGRGGSWVPVEDLPKIEERNRRWIEHLDMRITYERELLEDQGALLALLEKPKRPKAPPLLNVRCPELTSENEYNRGQIISYAQVEATKATYARIANDYKGTRTTPDGAFRFRIASRRALDLSGDAWGYVAVFLSDSKEHPMPPEVRL